MYIYIYIYVEIERERETLIPETLQLYCNSAMKIQNCIWASDWLMEVVESNCNSKDFLSFAEVSVYHLRFFSYLYGLWSYGILWQTMEVSLSLRFGYSNSVLSLSDHVSSRFVSSCFLHFWEGMEFGSLSGISICASFVNIGLSLPRQDLRCQSWILRKLDMWKSMWCLRQLRDMRFSWSSWKHRGH